MAFGVTPITSAPPPLVTTDIPQFVQIQDAGTDLGDASVTIINFLWPLIATRGTGENENVITVTLPEIPPPPPPPPPAPTTILFLNHFENLRSGGPAIASALGPDLTSQNGDGVLSSTQKVFGNSSGFVPANDELALFESPGDTPQIPMVETSWRCEGWFWQAEPSAQVFSFQGNSFIATITTNNTNPSFDLTYRWGGFLSESGGAVGNGSNQPAANAWHHAGIQYNNATGQYDVFLDGRVYENISGLIPNQYPSGTYINEISIGNPSTGDAYYDEMCLTQINDNSQLYGASTPGSYTVPTGPFSPLTP